MSETPAEVGPPGGEPRHEVLFVGARLPSRSETFVYREVLALRGQGLSVGVASVHPPQHGLGGAELEAMAEAAVPVYGRAYTGLVRGMAAAVVWPASWAALGLAHRIAWKEAPAGTTLRDRAKLLLQTVGGVALAHRVRRRGVRHIHAHMAHVPASVALAAAASLRVPFSVTGHAADLFRDGRFLRPKLERAAFVACISRWHRDWYRQTLGLSHPDPCLPIVRCGVDLPETPDRPSPGSGLLCVARLVPKKGIDVLLEAYAELVAMEPDGGPAVPGLEVIGDGPQRGALQALADRLGLTGRVRFRGAAPHAAVLEAVRACGLFVLAARQAGDGDRDGVPVVLMEAMAAGRPVVCGDAPAIRELVQDGVTGWVVPGGDASKLADRLRSVLSAGSKIGGTPHREAAFPPMVQQVADAGRERVASEFETGLNALRWIAAYQNIQAPRSRPSPSPSSSLTPSRPDLPGTRQACS